MRDSNRVIGDVDHGGVLYFINGVATDVSHFSALGDEYNVKSFEETHKPCKKGKKYNINIHT